MSNLDEKIGAFHRGGKRRKVVAYMVGAGVSAALLCALVVLEVLGGFPPLGERGPKGFVPYYGMAITAFMTARFAWMARVANKGDDPEFLS